MIGKIIGNYKIEQKLGEGGMGAVYKGVDTMLDREVAIKALRPELASQTSIVERFRSEAVTLAKLHHPNIATLYSLFRQGEELYMVLEFVRGETLERVLQRRGALPVEEVIPVFCQILDGINHAHEYGIVHRDIKPANMMLTEKGTLKVLDFGIARLLGSARMTRAGNIIGTLEYMSPEQVKGQETDARSDIYALGMMLYEMLTGRTPFDTENEYELMKMQTEQMPVPPSRINPQIPAEVEAAIMQAVAKDPNARFQTAGEMREVLLDAGFSEHGALRRSTGSRPSQIKTRPSQPPVSSPDSEETAILGNAPRENFSSDNFSDETEVLTHPGSEIKETRFDAGVAPALAAVETLKEIRLGAANYSNYSNTENYAIADEPAASFFSNLTWIHYAGASFIAVMFLGLLIIIPLFLFGGSGNSNNKPEAAANVNANVGSNQQNSQIVIAPNQPSDTSPSRITKDDTPLNNPSRISSNSMANNPPLTMDTNSNSMANSAPDSPKEVADKPKNEPKQNKPATKSEPPPKQREVVADKPARVREAPVRSDPVTTTKPAERSQKTLDRLSDN